MPGFFHKQRDGWQLVPIQASPALLHFDPVCIETDRLAIALWRSLTDVCLMLRLSGRNRWAALVAGDLDIRHNGVPLTAGLRILNHRDALAMSGGGALFFTTEERAHIEPFASGEPVVCPRCRSEVSAGDAVVYCPACGVVHHQSGDRPCWDYAENCAMCTQTTALDAGFMWTPEAL